MVVANTRVIKFVFINVIKLDTFHALVEVSKNCIKGLKQLIAWLHLILLTQEMILI